MTDFPSSKNLRYKKDSSEPHSSDFQRILPVQVDFGSLVNTINHRILGMEGNVTNLDKQLRIIEQIEAKLQEELKSCKESKARVEEAKAEVENARAELEKAKAEVEETNLRLTERLKVDRENFTREQDSLKKENSQLREQLKSLEGNKPGNGGKGKLVFFGERDCDTRSWLAARAECQTRGGDLATHLNEQEVDYVFRELIQPHMVHLGSLWIGGRMNKRATEANFKSSYEWLNGDRISADDVLLNRTLTYDYEGWVKLDFANKCMEINESGPRYDPTGCDWKRPYLCKI